MNPALRPLAFCAVVAVPLVVSMAPTKILAVSPPTRASIAARVAKPHKHLHRKHLRKHVRKDPKQGWRGAPQQPVKPHPQPRPYSPPVQRPAPTRPYSPPTWRRPPVRPYNPPVQHPVRPYAPPTWRQTPQPPVNRRYQPPVVHNPTLNRRPILPPRNLPPSWSNPGGNPPTQAPRPHYGSNYNFTGKSSRERQNFGWEGSHGRIAVRRFGHPPFGDEWRYGYHGRRGFRDRHFHFGFYFFSPFGWPVVVSPWYYYPELPPYIDWNAVTVVPDYSWDWNQGIAYTYRPAVPYASYGDRTLNAAVDAIRDIFSNGSQDAIDALVPTDGQVAIFSNGQYMYTLKGDQFQQMITDAAEDVDTTSFQVDSVRTLDGEAIVHCTDNFTDNDGGAHSVMQTYRLTFMGGRYVITAFMTQE